VTVCQKFLNGFSAS